MLNNIKSTFSIKDLENFSGIKQHTIRIWEKRYNLLEPDRTDSNIRYYDAKNFEKLLNVSLLYNNGLKISKIAQLSDQELIHKTDEIGQKRFINNAYHHYFKLAMLRYDVALFNKTYEKLLKTKSVSYIFEKIFFPLLDKIGHLWQTQSIQPSHEHFISYLIQQKLYVAIAGLQQNVKPAGAVCVLFLPKGEIHELGLLYVQHALLEKGKSCVYLGSSLSMSHLQPVTETFAEIHFISYFTVKPDNAQTYLKAFSKKYLNNTPHKLSYINSKKYTAKHSSNGQIQGYSSLSDFLTRNMR